MAAAIFTLDFSDDGTGLNEFKKAKEKKFVDLSNYKLDENLCDLERSLKLINTSVPIQICCAFRSLTRLSICAVLPPDQRSHSQQQEVAALENWSEKLIELFDAAVATVTDKNTEKNTIQNAVSCVLSFTNFVENNPPDSGKINLGAIDWVSTQLLRLILAVLNRGNEKNAPNKTSPSKEFIDGLEVLPRLMTFVPLESCISTAIPMASVMADVSRSDESRMVACNLLGAVAATNKITERQYEELLLPSVVCLCQDTSDDVRKAMSGQLGAFIRMLSTSTLINQMLSELLELLEDEKDKVRHEILLTTISILDILPATFIATSILPVLKQSFGLIDQTSSSDKKMAPSLPKQFGFMFYHLFTRTGIFDDEAERTANIDHFLKCYKTMSQSTNEDVRHSCAYNYPAVLKIVQIKSFEDHLLRNCLTRFVRDTGVTIRRLVGSFFHEVCHLLTPDQCINCLHKMFITLLQDSDFIVCSHVVEYINIILNSFQTREVEAKKVLYQDILPPIVMCLKDTSNNWRVQMKLVEHFAEFPKYFSHASLIRLVVPQLLKLLEGSGSLVQRAICRTLAIFGRDCPETRFHNDMTRRFENQFSCSDSHTKRKIYLLACSEMLKIHSSRFGRERLLMTIVSMFDDFVLDVKRRALLLIPLLWKHVLCSTDDNLIKKLLLERLDIEASEKANHILIVQTAREVTQAVTNILTSGNESKMGQEDARKQRDALMEKHEMELNVYKAQDISGSALRLQIVERLKNSNKELIKASNKRSAINMSSDEDMLHIATDTKNSSTKKGKKKSNSSGGSGSSSSSSSRSSKTSRNSKGNIGSIGANKPASLPKHGALPNIIKSKVKEEGTKTATMTANAGNMVSMSSKNSSGRNLNKIKRRGPPGKSKIGPRSPRAGKNTK